jgi:hopanoid C-3 methylase HpnR
MKVLAVHPNRLIYSRIFLCLEPLGLELVAEALRREGHEVKIVDLQVETTKKLFRLIKSWQPDVVAFSCSYLANVPEVIDLAKSVKKTLASCYVFVGGHSASFIAKDLLAHASGAIDCVLRGEGEYAAHLLLEALTLDQQAVSQVPGALTQEMEGPPPVHLSDLDRYFPARDLLQKRKKYYLGIMDPCASIEFSRGCPWDCSFCSAWTFYGRKYRLVDPEKAVEDLERIEEPGVFIVDDVAFVKPEHGMAIAEAVLKKGIKKRFYLETRVDVLLRNKDVFETWKTLGLEYMFVGLEAINEADLTRFRKRTTLSKNFEALEFARSLDIQVAVNIIADPSWDEAQFEGVREWGRSRSEIVNISINTPYPGTETWLTSSADLTTRDYRLFDINHAVRETRLPLGQFYEEFIKTQRVLYQQLISRKMLKFTARNLFKNLIRGQINFLKSIWNFNKIYDPHRFFWDHQQPVRYQLSKNENPTGRIDREDLYVLKGFKPK